MNFYVTSRSFDLSLIKKNAPCIVLITNNWNDYTYETLYKAVYFDKEGQDIDLGEVKILHKTVKYSRDIIPREFEQLSNEYCSLGQSLAYYKTIKNLDVKNVEQILLALNDVTINTHCYNEFKTHQGFNDSLLRFSEAEKALIEGPLLFLKEDRVNRNLEKIFKFVFSYKLPLATNAHTISFDFIKETAIPNRINVLIGKNGTGKTQILAKLAMLLSGYEKGDKSNFTPARPSFDKVIAISYSVFDEFERPRNDDRTFSYKYCGIRDNENKILSQQDMKIKFKESLKEIREAGLEEKWRSILNEIIEPEHRNILETLVEDTEGVQLSSGQNLIITTITEVIANITPESILLFDEPETHLHPNAISNLMRMLNLLLEEFNSYAIISTHSPIILQEIPAKYVNVFERNNYTPSVRNLHVECFGDNLTNITNEVFEVSNVESNYKNWFDNIVKTLEYEQILELFTNPLSYNAMTYLNIASKKKDDIS
ncbi:TPA: ATP-dependent endonuclease [Bacillus paranthracis]